MAPYTSNVMQNTAVSGKNIIALLIHLLLKNYIFKLLQTNVLLLLLISADK